MNTKFRKIWTNGHGWAHFYRFFVFFKIFSGGNENRYRQKWQVPFVDEVEPGLWGILSQWSCDKQKLYPVIFFSHNLTFTERKLRTLQSNCHWNNEDIGWRVQHNQSLFIQTTRIWNNCVQQRGSIHARPDGLSFLQDLLLCYHSIQVQRTLKLKCCLELT